MFSNGGFDVLDPRITKLQHFATFSADQMIVLLVCIGFFELRQVFTELMLADQVTGQQQVNGVVERGPAHPVVLILHLQVERFHVKMTFMVVDLFQYGKPFGGFPMLVFFQVSGKDLSDFFFGIDTRHL